MKNTIFYLALLASLTFIAHGMELSLSKLKDNLPTKQVQSAIQNFAQRLGITRSSDETQEPLEVAQHLSIEEEEKYILRNLEIPCKDISHQISEIKFHPSGEYFIVKKRSTSIDESSITYIEAWNTKGNHFDHIEYPRREGNIEYKTIFTSDGKRLYVGTYSGVDVFNVNLTEHHFFQRRGSIETGNPENGFALHPKGTFLVSTDGSIFDTESNKKIGKVDQEEKNYDYKFDPTGRILASNTQAADIVIYSYDGNNLQYRYKHPGPMKAKSFSQDGTTLVCMDFDELNKVFLLNMKCLDTQCDVKYFDLGSPFPLLMNPEFHPNGRNMLFEYHTLHEEEKVVILNLETKQIIHSFPGGNIFALAPNGNLLVTGHTMNRNLRFYDLTPYNQSKEALNNLDLPQKLLLKAAIGKMKETKEKGGTQNQRLELNKEMQKTFNGLHPSIQKIVQPYVIED